MASHMPTLAMNRRLIQPARTGMTGSSSAAWVLVSSAKGLALAAVGGSVRQLAVLVEQMVTGEPFGQLARLGVAHPDPVAELQRSGRRALDRGLHLARAFHVD